MKKFGSFIAVLVLVSAAVAGLIALAKKFGSDDEYDYDEDYENFDVDLDFYDCEEEVEFADPDGEGNAPTDVDIIPQEDK